MKKNTWKKGIASLLAGTVVIAAVPANTNLKAMTSLEKPVQLDLPETWIDTATSVRPEKTKAPHFATDSSIIGFPKQTRAPHFVTDGSITADPKETRAPHSTNEPHSTTDGSENVHQKIRELLI